MVTIGQENRLYGADSLLEMGKYPKSTFNLIQRTFGKNFDSDWIAKFKKEYMVFNDYVSDDRSQVAWKVTRPAYGDTPASDEILYSEEVVAMMFSYVKMLAEIQAETHVRDCVITIPSWFTYDQRLMIKDAAELANLKVLQLVHENTAAAVMYGIDNRVEPGKNKVVLFYNMGSTDTEVTIANYSMFNITEKKSSPYIEILSEAYDQNLGSRDLENSLVRILGRHFNELSERQGKDDVLLNERAVGRLKKDAIKAIEVLSANKFASIKVPELLDYVTLQFNLPREEFETENEKFWARVNGPIDEALNRAGLQVSDIDEIQLLGGGARVPKVSETIQAKTQKELGVKLNGDEAMCFGSAFIATNCSSDFKVKQIFLTQHPQNDIYIKISPINASDALTEEEQKAEGVEEADIIKYTQDFRLFNTSDYIGKSKALNLNYNRNMRIELFKAIDNDAANLLLLDTFLLKDLKFQQEYEAKQLKAQQVRDAKKEAKEKAKKKKEEEKKDEKEEEKKEEKETKKEEPIEINEEELPAIPTPKIKVSIELSRSGYMQVTKATAGNSPIDVEKVRKEVQLTDEQLA